MIGRIAVIALHIYMAGKNDDETTEIPTAAEQNIYRPWLDLRCCDRTSNLPRRLDLHCGRLRPSVGFPLGLDSRPPSRIVSGRSDDLFMAIGRSNGSLCSLQSFRDLSAFTELHRRSSCHLRHRNHLVVAHGLARQNLAT
jgi:hypothetical protein